MIELSLPQLARVVAPRRPPPRATLLRWLALVGARKRAGGRAVHLASFAFCLSGKQTTRSRMNTDHRTTGSLMTTRNDSPKGENRFQPSFAKS